MKNIELQKLLATLPPDAEVIFGINDGDEGGSCEVTVKMDPPALSSVGTMIENGRVFVYGDGDTRVVLFGVDEQYIYQAMRDRHLVDRFDAKLQHIFPGDQVVRGALYLKNFLP